MVIARYLASHSIVVVCVTSSLAGPPDRTELTTYLSPSPVVLSDRNGDCAVSDVDVAMILDDRLVELYGPQFETLGDLDGDGNVTSEDVIAAISKLLKSAYGKTTSDWQPVNTSDVFATVEAVLSQLPEGDINFDGLKDVADIFVTTTQLGTSFTPSEVDQIARKAYTYVGALRQLGREHFMASACAPTSHLEGVSNTWPPNRPTWWPPNHLTGISGSYPPPSTYWPHGHTIHDSNNLTSWPEHEARVSKTWPANHMWDMSRTWTSPPAHGVIASAASPPPHAVGVSGHWPAGHSSSASTTWPDDHDQNTSRTWWPHHTASNSQRMVVPPVHIDAISMKWSHQASASQMVWPPNHYSSVSGGWGPTHAPGTSGSWPPAHLNYASNGWPGPQPSWPSTHTVTVSTSWGEPSPGSWPIFPPDHSWWTTFRDIPGIVPQFPWPP